MHNVLFISGLILGGNWFDQSVSYTEELEQSGVVGSVHISETTYKHVKDVDSYSIKERPPLPADKQASLARRSKRVSTSGHDLGKSYVVTGAPSKLRRGKQQGLMAKARDEEVEQQKVAGHQELKRAFEKIDTAGSGAIDASEIKALMEELGESVTAEQAQRMLEVRHLLCIRNRFAI